MQYCTVRNFRKVKFQNPIVQKHFRNKISETANFLIYKNTANKHVGRDSGSCIFGKVAYIIIL